MRSETESEVSEIDEGEVCLSNSRRCCRGHVGRGGNLEVRYWIVESGADEAHPDRGWQVHLQGNGQSNGRAMLHETVLPKPIGGHCWPRASCGRAANRRRCS